MRGRARARARRDRARARDRAHAAGGRPLPGALRRADRAAALGTDRGRAARRARADRVRRGARRRRRALGGLRAGARARADRRRRGARPVVQAGVRPALRRPHGRGEARGARGRGRGLRQRDAAARELGGARAARARRAARSGSCRRCASSTCAARRGYPLSAPLLAELGKIAERGGKAILLLNRRGLAPAIHCRTCGVTRRCPNCDVALVLHGDGAALPPLRPRASRRPSSAPSAARPSSPGIGAGTQRLERELAARLPELELIRLDADTKDPTRRARALRRRRPRRPARHADGREGPPLRGRRAGRGRRRRHRPGAAGLPRRGADVPAPHAARRAAAAATRRAACSSRPSSPTRAPVELAARHDVERFLAGELERREALGYPPFRHLVRIVVAGPEPDAPMRALEELKAALGGDELLGPAPLLRLRGRHRAQLVAKTDRPGALAARAGRRRSPPPRRRCARPA